MPKPRFLKPNAMPFRAVMIVFVGAVLALAMNNCDNVKLSLMPAQIVQTSKSIPEICALPPSERDKLTKILFVVDMSGSNMQTDPGKTFRNTLMRDYVIANQNNPLIHYGLIVFQRDGAVAYVNVGGNDARPAFSNNIPTVIAALDRFVAATDADATPYRAALTLAQQAIRDDRQASPGAISEYRVVMISDGVPTDYGNPINETAIDADVTSLIVSASEATLSTIYYGPMDAVAAARLERMAQRGNGKFSNVNVDGRIPIEQLIAGKQGEPWVIRRFMVTNLTSAPCDDGTMGTDSDADGLCDKDEIRYNQELPRIPAVAARMDGKRFDPTKRNSFGNAYNDYINYRRVVYGEAVDVGCTLANATDDDHDLLNQCEETFLTSARPVGPTGPWTEKMGTGADAKNFDSDGDGFLDYIEFIFGRSQGAALDFDSSVHLMTEGFRFDDILLQHRHPMRPTLSTPYEANFHFTHVNKDGQNCYTYDQKVLPLYPTQALNALDAKAAPQLAHGAGENVILIYFVQTTERDANAPGVLNHAYQRIHVNSAGKGVNVDEVKYDVYRPVEARANQ